MTPVDDPGRPSLSTDDNAALSRSSVDRSDSRQGEVRRDSTPGSHRSSFGALSGTKSHSKRRSKSRKLVRKIENLLGLPKGRKGSSAAPRTPLSDRSQLLFDEDEDDDADNGKDTTLTRPFIKIRMATANMHDFLPTGDLSDFLGELKPSQFRKRHHSVSSHASKRSREAQLQEGQPATGSNAKPRQVAAPELEGLPILPYGPEHPCHIIAIAGQECPTASGVLGGKVRALDGRGWTSTLEDWLCGPADGEDVFTDTEKDANELRPPRDRDEASIAGEARQGPYVLVEKLRLMGIYCAVFVLSECRHLVTGVSAGRVTAGLVGGRVGNKGAVAISLHFAGQRLLFVSAHLAAHAHAVDVRKANVRKIFDEMVIDDFCGSGPKAGGLPDRFDQTFFMGDLNFRLNVTRQHADWLIKNKDITNGLAFDQLREILADPDGCFRGFKEGEIAFAPTYKYDVNRKKRSAVPRSDKQAKRPAREWVSYEPAEVDPGSVSDPEVLQATRDKDPEDVLSLISDRDSFASGLSDYEKIEKDDIPVPAGTPSSPPKGNPTSVDVIRRSSQVRFMNLVRNNSAAAALTKHLKHDSATQDDKQPRKLSIHDIPATRFVRPVLRSAHSDVTVPMSRTSLGESSSAGSSVEHSEDDEPALRNGAANGEQGERYDTSSKQRVQSWTDRILYRSNVVVDDGDDEDDEHLIDSYFRRPSNIADTIRDLFQGLGSSASTTLHKSKTAVVDRALAEKATVKLQRWQSEAASRQSHSQEDSPSRTTSPFADIFRKSGRLSREQSPETVEPGIKRSKSLRERVQRNPSLTASTKKSGSSDRIAQLRGQRRVSADELGNSRPPKEQTRSASMDLSRRKSLKFAENGPVTEQRKPRRPSFHLRSSSSSRSIPESNSLRLATVPSAPLPMTSDAMSDGPVPLREMPQSSTQVSARSASGATSPAAAAGDAGLGRIKSFFHLPSLSFFQSRGVETEAPVLSPNSILSPVNTAPLIVGPRKGQVEILKYDAVSDMVKMGAMSDHRPVYAVAAIGIGGKPVPVRNPSE
ncbi:hypothetical protein ACM66B_001156 [Microbotryomycetes sp. NB124-2]